MKISFNDTQQNSEIDFKQMMRVEDAFAVFTPITDSDVRIIKINTVWIYSTVCGQVEPFDMDSWSSERFTRDH